LGGQNLKFSIVFKSAGKKKIKEKQKFLRKFVLAKIGFGVALKQMTTDT